MNSNVPGGRARCVMVLGTTSGAGKSWLATALCRWFARQGLRVAPFKAQNMSNNARVVAGGEIGSAQYFQALAARAEPQVQMNPLLLKPERDTHSQVVLLGQVSAELTALPWRAYQRHSAVVSQLLPAPLVVPSTMTQRAQVRGGEEFMQRIVLYVNSVTQSRPVQNLA